MTHPDKMMLFMLGEDILINLKPTTQLKNRLTFGTKYETDVEMNPITYSVDIRTEVPAKDARKVSHIRLPGTRPWSQKLDI
jgi:hypothetical protein